VAVIEYRCVCGETITLETTQGGQCGSCGRHYAAAALRNAAAETLSVADLSDRDQILLAEPVEETEERIGQSMGHFEIVRLLGRGGMGSVYQALDKSLQRYVALKVIRGAARSAADTRQLQRLFQEAIAQARVNHPNVVHIYFVGREQGSPFLAMELVLGTNLGTRLQQGALPFPEVVTLGIQLADALRACLSFDIVHGDIKPSNVLLTEAGSVKLSDFGLATRLSVAGETDQALSGTPDYLAPELADGRPPDMRSDLYSLGLTLFEMTFGRPPYKFSGTTVQERLATHQRSAVAFPEPWPPEVPEGWKTVLLRLLAKQPERRYESYDALLADLRRFRPVNLPSAGRLPRGLAWIVDLALASTAQQVLGFPVRYFFGRDPTFAAPLAAIAAAASFAIVPVAVALWQSRGKATPGKKLFQIRIVDRYGLAPSPARLAARSVFQMLPIWGEVVFTTTDFLGFGPLSWIFLATAIATALTDATWAIVSRERRSIHDLIFDTRVVLDAVPKGDSNEP
jgi:uncharacterized RDD family membrane protein YckC